MNPDGTLLESGPGWNGYESQNLADLITRAHATNDRVVLTVTDFSQASLNALTSSPTAATTLASALVSAVGAKNLDGVNLDLEGEGSADQAGLTRLVGTVSSALHQANPHYQVTMDTYASSATDSGGFYNIPALAPLIDAFFVMEYSPNLSASSSASSPLTSGLFSDQTTVDEVRLRRRRPPKLFWVCPTSASTGRRPTARLRRRRRDRQPTWPWVRS